MAPEISGPNSAERHRSSRTLIDCVLEMAAKKGGAILVRLVSAAGTGFFYVKKKNPRTWGQRKLNLIKFDPIVNAHVLFTEKKMK